MAVTTAIQSDNERLNDDQKKRLNAIHEKYNAPGTSEATKKILHDAAEMIRAEAGYSGGTSGNTPTPIKKTKSPKTVVEPAEAEAFEYPAMPQYDIRAEIERLAQERLASRKAALKSLRDKTLSSLQAEKSTIAPAYYDLKNTASANSQLRGKKLSELMAAKGYSEGMQGQKMVSENATLQSNLGSLGRQEQSAYDDIARRGTEAEQAYQSGLAQAKADVSSQEAEQMLQELGTLRNYARDDARYADTRSDVLYNRDYQQSKDAMSDYTNTVGRFYNDYAAEINNVKNDGDPSNDWQLPILESARQQKLQNIEALKQSEAEAVAKGQKESYDRAYKMWETLGYATPEIASILGIPQGTRTESYVRTQSSINRQGSSGSGGAIGGLGNTDFDNVMRYWQAIGRADDKVSKLLGVPIGATYGGSFAGGGYDDYVRYIDSAYLTNEMAGNESTGRKILSSENKANLEAYLASLYSNGVSKEIVDALAVRYGIE
jgi:hypothetical protein